MSVISADPPSSAAAAERYTRMPTFGSNSSDFMNVMRLEEKRRSASAEREARSRSMSSTRPSSARPIRQPAITAGTASISAAVMK